jgi:hypothetical protein
VVLHCRLHKSGTVEAVLEVATVAVEAATLR